MYLHINKNCVIKNNSIIGIFSKENISELSKNIENINDLSDGNPRTFILTENKGKIIGYISKLNVDTIKKRKI